MEKLQFEKKNFFLDQDNYFLIKENFFFLKSIILKSAQICPIFIFFFLKNKLEQKLFLSLIFVFSKNL